LSDQPERCREGDNGVMVPIAAVLLLLIVAFSVAVVVSNPGVFDLSIFGAKITVNTAGVYFTGAGAMLILLLAAALMYTGLKRQRQRKKEIRRLKAAVGPTSTPSATQPTSAAATTAATTVGAGEDRSSAKTPPAAVEADRATEAEAAPKPVDFAQPSDARPAGTVAGPHTGEPSASDRPTTSAAERQAMLDEADALNHDKPHS
jgi:ABC-type nickel/cobalt efflux system permease component RcnA